MKKKKTFDKKGNNFVVSITVTVDISKRLDDSSWIKYPIITQVGPGRSVPGFLPIGVAASTSYQISLEASSYHILKQWTTKK